MSIISVNLFYESTKGNLNLKKMLNIYVEVSILEKQT